MRGLTVVSERRPRIHRSDRLAIEIAHACVVQHMVRIQPRVTHMTWTVILNADKSTHGVALLRDSATDFSRWLLHLLFRADSLHERAL